MLWALFAVGIFAAFAIWPKRTSPRGKSGKGKDVARPLRGSWVVKEEQGRRLWAEELKERVLDAAALVPFGTGVLLPDAECQHTKIVGTTGSGKSTAIKHMLAAVERRQEQRAVNATRWSLLEALKATGLPVETGSGGRTKWNRARLGIPKTHALDAACVGDVDRIEGWQMPALTIKATGRGSYCRTRLTRHGFPRGCLMRCKRVRGFQTGDLVKSKVPTGKKAGTYVGRVAVRASGSFNIQTPLGVNQGIPARHCSLLQRANGYAYSLRPRATPTLHEERRFLSGLNAGVSAPEIGG